MMIRSAEVKDVAAMAKIINHVIRDTMITFNSQEKTEAEIAEAIKTTPYFVAVHQGQIVGQSSYFPFRAGPGYAKTVEYSISVTPAAHGLGAGRGLLDAVVSHARLAGMTTLVAGMNADNTPARGFHAVMGFVETGHMPGIAQKFGQELDLILAQKHL
jgi:phosphinothricin acetyltransferase